ncbi:unnamed protein product, partial [Linum tenue]
LSLVSLEKKNVICNQFGGKDRDLVGGCYPTSRSLFSHPTLSLISFSRSHLFQKGSRYQIQAPSRLSQSSFALYHFLERMKAWNKRCNQFPPKESDADDEHHGGLDGEGQSGEGEKSRSTINSPAIAACSRGFAGKNDSRRWGRFTSFVNKQDSGRHHIYNG